MCAWLHYDILIWWRSSMQTSGSGSHFTISSHLLCSSNHKAWISTLVPLEREIPVVTSENLSNIRGYEGRGSKVGWKTHWANSFNVGANLGKMTFNVVSHKTSHLGCMDWRETFGLLWKL
ncbi:hypothetical protein SUGI_0132280 [Cryptomeria japonica]|nr:hypothetical protein SUGI_0132280 [Cryptomeria japonica]